MDVIVPADVNPTESASAACSAPVADVVERTTPRATAAVRGAAAGVLVPATTKYDATPAPARAAPSATFRIPTLGRRRAARPTGSRLVMTFIDVLPSRGVPGQSLEPAPMNRMRIGGGRRIGPVPSLRVRGGRGHHPLRVAREAPTGATWRPRARRAEARARGRRGGRRPDRRSAD